MAEQEDGANVWTVIFVAGLERISSLRNHILFKPYRFLKNTQTESLETWVSSNFFHFLTRYHICLGPGFLH